MEEFWQPQHIEMPEVGIVPMFPLHGVFLFPGQILPLQIFEPRYLQMVEDLLDGPGRIVMGTILEGEQTVDDESPEVLPIAGLGEIARHEKLPDGRYAILLFGLGRVQISEVPSDRMYRKVECGGVHESQPSHDEVDRLQEPLIEAIRTRTGFSIENADQISTAQLTDILAQTLSVPQSLMEEIFAEAEVGLRADKVLAAHAEFPPERTPDS